MAPGTLSALVPAPWRGPIRSAYLRVRNAGIRFYCNVCDAPLRKFMAYGFPSESEFLCPVCFSKPPHRLAEYFFAANPQLFESRGGLIHVAPEAGLARKLSARARRCGMAYRSGWIDGLGDQHLDLLALDVESDSVALLYCCHVLNCMQDDRAAMSEVRRVLHPDGIAILQVPAFHLGSTTLETGGEEERLAEFADKGIYRRYTNDDYEARLRKAGFDVLAFRAKDLPAEVVRKYQLKEEVLHLCRKTS